MEVKTNIEKVLTSIYNMLCEVIDQANEKTVTVGTSGRFQLIEKAAKRGTDKIKDIVKNDDQLPELKFDFNRYVPLEAVKVVEKAAKDLKAEESLKKKVETLSSNLKVLQDIHEKEIAALKAELEEAHKPKVKEDKPKAGQGKGKGK
jgi:hypothetical protein